MKTAGLSEREKLMLPTAFAIIAIVLYTSFRWKPAHLAIKTLQRELQSAIDGRANLKFPNPENQSPEQLAAQLEEITATLQETQSHLSVARGHLVNLEDGEDLQDLKIQISTLAQESRVTIVESIPDQSTSRSQGRGRRHLSESLTLDAAHKASAPVSHEAFQSLYQRPWQRISMRSSFLGLLHFARGLEALDWQVTLVGFSIKTQENQPQFDSPQLDATFVLAL